MKFRESSYIYNVITFLLIRNDECYRIVMKTSLDLYIFIYIRTYFISMQSVVWMKPVVKLLRLLLLRWKRKNLGNVGDLKILYKNAKVKQR